MISIDEQMIPFKRKSFLKQYIPSKPYKWGYKVFMVCDRTGLPLNFEIYTGKTNHVPGWPDAGANGNVVIKLAQILDPHANHLLYFDN